MKSFLNSIPFPNLSRTAFWVPTAFGVLMLQFPISATESDPGGIEWELASVKDADGAWWNAFRIQAIPGVRYDIEKTPDLDDSWSTIASYQGGEMEIVHPLFPGTPPSATALEGPSTVVVPSPSSVPLKFAFVVMETTVAGDVVLSWSSCDSGYLVRYGFPGVKLDPVWEEFEKGYMNIHENYMMAISPRLQRPAPHPAPQPILSALDQAFATAFLAALPVITLNVTASVANASHLSSPPDPDPNSRGFFRIRADWSVDSDGDGRFDWQELLQDGNNPYLPDSDGDGIPDGTDLPNPLLSTSPAAPIRPPVAEFEHRYVAGSKELLYRGAQIGISGSAFRSDEEAWTWGSTEFETLIQAENFAELTASAAALPVESPWQKGVVSLEALNLEDENPDGSLAKTEWQNFKTEYRLALPEDAPEGGYLIPLEFAKIHYEWIETTDDWVPTYSGGVTESDSISIILYVPEGERESQPVQVPLLDVGVNRRIKLVPADIAVLEGNGSVAADGLCLQLGESFKLDFNGVNSPAYKCGIPDDWITWEVRRLEADGTFEEWRSLGSTVKGCEVYAEIADLYGCFQIRAHVSSGPGVHFRPQAVRMRDATHAVDRLGDKNPNLVAGKPEYVGVANCPLAEVIRNGVVNWLGSTDYAFTSDVEIKSGYSYNPSTLNKNKCNIFITHAANAAGASTPYFYRHFGLVPSAPIARSDWYTEPEENIDLDSPGWHFMGDSEPLVPGMAVASYGAMVSGSGHCGIIDYDGAWINAGKNSVNKSIHATHINPNYMGCRMRIRLHP